jgi:hypothetical protein
MPAEVAPLGNRRQQANINRKLNMLARQPLHDPLPNMPKGGQTAVIANTAFSFR